MADDIVELTVVRAEFEIEQDLKDLEFCRLTLAEVGYGWARVKVAWRKNKYESGFEEHILNVKDQITLKFEKPWKWTD